MNLSSPNYVYQRCFERKHLSSGGERCTQDSSTVPLGTNLTGTDKFLALVIRKYRSTWVMDEDFVPGKSDKQKMLLTIDNCSAQNNVPHTLKQVVSVLPN